MSWLASLMAGARAVPADPVAQCGACRNFRNDAAYLEAAFAGLTSLSSGSGSVRADDGICRRHDRYLSARASCAQFAPRLPEASAEAER